MDNFIIHLFSNEPKDMGKRVKESACRKYSALGPIT